jgi:hypothetical protein
MPEESNQNQHSFDETNGSTLWDFLRFLITNKQGQRVITGMAAILAVAVLGTVCIWKISMLRHLIRIISSIICN